MRTADRPLRLPGGRVANQKSVSLDSNSIRRGVRGSRGRSLSLVHNPISRLLIRVHQRGTDTSTELQTRVTHLFFSPSPTSDGVASGVSPRADQKGTGWGCAQKKNLPLQAKRYVNERDNTHPPLLSSDRSLPTTHQPPLPGA